MRIECPNYLMKEKTKESKDKRLVETLVVENTSLEEKVKNLEVELSQARTQIERMCSP